MWPSASVQDRGATSVDVVGYSAGGVVARLWVRDKGGVDLARRVLTLGSPHHGTTQAALGAEFAGGCPPACEQLVPDSDVLRRLNAGDETPDGPLWATIRSTSDQVVTPVESAPGGSCQHPDSKTSVRPPLLPMVIFRVTRSCWPHSARCWVWSRRAHPPVFAASR